MEIVTNSNLAKSIRDQVHVCQVGGHVMCCIGDPAHKDSLVIDPWLKYLNLPSKSGYRSAEVSWLNQIRSRGFMGRVDQYQQFLADHPNCYVPSGVDLTLKINPHFSELTKPLTPADIEIK